MINKIQNFILKALIVFASTFIFFYFEKNRGKIVSTLTSNVKYIMGCPFGIKQSFVVKTTLGNAYLQLLSPGYTSDIISSIKVCCFITFKVYRHTFLTLKEIFHLLNNKTYNPVMKRFDSIYLNIDQIVLSIMMLSVLSIFWLNLMLFYIFFAIIYLLIEIAMVLQSISIEIIFTGHLISVFTILKSEFKKSVFYKNFFYRLVNGQLITLFENDD